MDDLIALVFRAEVLEGQHPAVVRKRLQEALKIREDQLDKLFSGSPVVLKKAADAKTAARYQRLFKQAGARLRVLPVRDPADPVPVAPASSDTASTAPAARKPAAAQAPASSPAPTASSPASATASSPAPEDPAGLSLAPPGTAVLAEHERPRVEAVEVTTDHLRLAGAVFDLPDPDPVPADGNGAPDAPDFSLASAGSDLLEEHERARPAVVVADVEFEVAEAGADLGTAAAEPPPPAPDTSALQLVSD